MQWALFFSTFWLVFFAELGDKTQLAVMSQSASNAAKWTVFAAGVLALAVSTAIGVVAGDQMRRFVPDQRVIKVAGGLLFLVIGALMVREAWRPRQTASGVSASVSARRTGWIGRFVIRQAAVFERSAALDYEAMARQSENPRERELFRRLASEERWHHSAMCDALRVGAHNDIEVTADLAATLPDLDELTHRAAECGSKGVQRAIQHELAAARFYGTLADRSKLPQLRDTFRALAASEESHARRLLELEGCNGAVASAENVPATQ